MSTLATAARDVPVGASWAFKDHRTMAEVMAMEQTEVRPQHSGVLRSTHDPVEGLGQGEDCVSLSGERSITLGAAALHSARGRLATISAPAEGQGTAVVQASGGSPVHFRPSRLATGPTERSSGPASLGGELVRETRDAMPATACLVSR